MKLHELSERTRKIILWTTIIVLGIVLSAWWVRGVSEKLGTIQKESLEVEFPEIPDINIEDINEKNDKGQE